MDGIKIVPAGDSAVSVRFEERISPEIHRRVMAFDRAVEEADIAGALERVPSYSALLVTYDPVLTSFDALCARLFEIEPKPAAETLKRAPVELPVLYGGRYGEDLPSVAAERGMSEEEVVSIHSSAEYLVYMLGFTPGFPYLGGMDGRIASPRLKTPRTRVRAGSVGIAGAQTGVYPVDSPGGWRLIGRTPLSLYDAENAEKPFFLSAGDTLVFRPVSEEEYLDLGGEKL